MCTQFEKKSKKMPLAVQSVTWTSQKKNKCWTPGTAIQMEKQNAPVLIPLSVTLNWKQKMLEWPSPWASYQIRHHELVRVSDPLNHSWQSKDFPNENQNTAINRKGKKINSLKFTSHSARRKSQHKNYTNTIAWEGEREQHEIPQFSRNKSNNSNSHTHEPNEKKKKNYCVTASNIQGKKSHRKYPEYSEAATHSCVRVTLCRQT